MVLEGSVTLYTGPMFSGKSTRVGRLLGSAADSGYSTILLSPTIDTRASDAVVTADGLRLPAVGLPRGASLINVVRAHSSVIPEYVAVDEVSFLDASQVAEAYALGAAGVQVLFAGLSYDWKNEPFRFRDVTLQSRFSSMEDLLASKDVESYILASDCDGCGVLKGAYNSFDKLHGLDATDQIAVGGKDRYDALCDCCYASAMRGAGLVVVPSPLLVYR